MAQAVGQHRVLSGTGAKHVQHDEDEQEPADRVARLASRDNEAHTAIDQDDGNPHPAPLVVSW